MAFDSKPGARFERRDMDKENHVQGGGAGHANGEEGAGVGFQEGGRDGVEGEGGGVRDVDGAEGVACGRWGEGVSVDSVGRGGVSERAGGAERGEEGKGDEVEKAVAGGGGGSRAVGGGLTAQNPQREISVPSRSHHPRLLWITLAVRLRLIGIIHAIIGVEAGGIAEVAAVAFGAAADFGGRC